MRITLGQLTDADSPLLLPSYPVHQEPDRTAVTGERCRGPGCSVRWSNAAQGAWPVW